VFITGTVDDVTFNSCHFKSNNLGAGIGAHAAISDGTNIKFLGCDFSGSANRGIQIDDLSGTPSKVKIANCDFAGTTNEAIFISSASRRHRVSGCDSDKSKTVALAASITLPYEHDSFIISGTTTINAINGGLADRMVRLRFPGALTVSDAVGNLNLAGNFVTTADDYILLEYNESAATWYEVTSATNRPSDRDAS
jgi:hypothetical protein